MTIAFIAALLFAVAFGGSVALIGWTWADNGDRILAALTMQPIRKRVPAVAVDETPRRHPVRVTRPLASDRLTPAPLGPRSPVLRAAA